MSALKSTPGPWSAGPAHVVAQRTIDDQGRHVTRFVAEALLSAPIVEGEREANAHLIAAAPELYEACEGVLARFESGENLSRLEAGWLRAALALARGENAPGSEEMK